MPALEATRQKGPRIQGRNERWAATVRPPLFFRVLLAALFALIGVFGTAHADDSGGTSATYQNPIRLTNEWFAYGIGDPFIMRWNGRYYLYPSTRTHGGGEVGIRVWVSEDLVNWDYAGYASRDLATYNAFAPEVVYWNGTFYMYTSSNGRGHYVLTSDGPTGPFVAQTGNIGLSIDGSVFIDDDGAWYFTHAGNRGIRAYRMADPFTMTGGPRLLDADLGAWTEGPMIIKRDGYYYITFTGNHVVSKGYRVHYAVSEIGPLGPYVAGANNPILLRTDDDFHGLGHSSTVLGPDLDSYYIAYHDIQNRLADHVRRMNIDRLVFNGKKMSVLGPTRFPQPVPNRPDFYGWIDEESEAGWMRRTVAGDGFLLSSEETKSDYTAEFNFQLSEASLAPARSGAFVGIVFSYQDDDRYTYASIDVSEKRMEIGVVDGGDRRILDDVRLPPDTDFAKLHTMRVVKAGERLKLFFDNLLKADLHVGADAGGRIGYIYRGVDPVLRFTAFSNDAGGSSDRHVYKPIPGEIESVHYSGSGASPNAHEDFPDTVDRPLITGAGDGSFAVGLSRPGDWLTYNVNVERDGLYRVDVMAKIEGDHPTIEWWVDGVYASSATLPDAPDVPAGHWFKMRAGEVELKEGLHTLTMRLQRGEIVARRLDIYPVASEPFALVDPLTEGIGSHWELFGASRWVSSDTGLRAPGAGGSMMISGKSDWADYVAQVDIDLSQAFEGAEAGLLVRATHPSYHPDQVRDAVIAYYIAFTGESLTLKKLNYGSETIASVPATVDASGTNRLKVESVGHTLRVFWNETPVIVYADPDAWMHGAVGLRSNTSRIAFRHLSVASVHNSI